MRRNPLSRTQFFLFITILLCVFSIPSTSALGIGTYVNESTIHPEITRDYWPTEEWRTSTPQEHGMNNATLNAMLNLIKSQEYPINSIFIVKDGYVVFDEQRSAYYPPTRKYLLHSVTKSFTGTLIGIALQQGLLSGVNEPVLDFFPDYEIANPSSWKDSMTIEDLLTMTAGMDWDEWSTSYEDAESNTLVLMAQASDCIQYILDRPMAYAPGTHWTYNGGATNLLGAIIPRISNMATYRCAKDFLFTPLGIEDSHWYLMNGGWYNCHGGLKLTTSDMAKLGYLYLNNGTWNGTQILSEEFVANATTPNGFKPYTDERYGYGWQWWTCEDLGIFFAWGRHGQKIMVSREHDMVVAFNAMIPDGAYDPELDLFHDYILRSIELGPDDPTVGTFPVLELLLVAIITPAALAAIYMILLKSRHH